MRSVAHGTFRRFYGCAMIRGIKPEDFSVEPPTKFDLIVNLCSRRDAGLYSPNPTKLRTLFIFSRSMTV